MKYLNLFAILASIFFGLASLFILYRLCICTAFLIIAWNMQRKYRRDKKRWK